MSSGSPAGHGGGRRGVMALLEVLRAPLLLSPVSDVAAGWAVTTLALGSVSGEAGGSRGAVPTEWIAATVCGMALLGAGMAQNALLDRKDDAARKPDRPLPRGTVSVGLVTGTFAALTVGALAVALIAPGVLPVALAIVVLTAAYHTVLKPWRLPGCLTLGTLRGLDMALGATAAAGSVGALLELPWTTFSPLLACGAYALYITGASLHASTDDGPGEESWSRWGLSIDVLVLTCLGWVAASASSASPATSPATSLATALVFAFALVRLVVGWRRLPPPPLTGVALSNMYLLGAGLCLGAGQTIAGMVVLGLFVLSRRMMRVFPPS